MKCVSPCLFITLNREKYDSFAKKQASKDQSSKTEFMGQLPFLKHWTSTQLKKMIENFKFENYKRN